MDLGETRKDLDEGGSKKGDYFESRITDEVQDMSVEDTIDLTFDWNKKVFQFNFQF